MTWEFDRPIYHKLPTDSGDWQGNPVVDYLTSFWDSLLVETKRMIDNPEQWIGAASQGKIDPYFLDWIGIGLCGYSVFWHPDLPIDVKMRLISNQPAISDRTSLSAALAVVKALDPDIEIERVKLARAGVARAGLSYTYQPRDNRYWITIPHTIKRGSLLWSVLERVIWNWLPIGLGRVQYAPTAAGLTVAGDSVFNDNTRVQYEF